MFRSLVTLALLLSALVLGGSALAPRMELAVQLLFAFAAAALVIEHHLHGRSWPGISGAAWLIAGLVLLLPIAQLVPLPPSVWHALPGRAIEREALALVASDNGWMPWSMTPDRSLASLLAMVPPVALFLLATTLTPAWRRRSYVLVVAMGLATALLGTLQLAAGETGEWRLYPQTHLLYVTGFFANRNATADLLLIAILALTARWVSRPTPATAIGNLGFLAIGVMLAATLALTGSRTGIVLLVLVLTLVAIMIGSTRRTTGSFGRPIAMLGTLGTFGLLGAIAMQLPAMRPIIARFLFDGDNRWMLWEDTRVAIEGVWPAGSGIGSFQPLFLASQQLEFVDPSMPISAHNDWLEFTLEAGLPGWIVLLVLAVILFRECWRGWPRAAEARGPAAARRAELLFGLGALGIIAAHSLVDYPLRTMALACLAAFAAAMIFSGQGHPSSDKSVSADQG